MTKVLMLKNKKDRDKLTKTLQEAKVRVHEDSGERLVVIDTPRDKAALLKKLPSGSQLVDSSSVRITAPDENEKLFLDALKLRRSKAFKDAHKKRKPGTTPEEKAQFTVSDTNEV